MIQLFCKLWGFDGNEVVASYDCEKLGLLRVWRGKEQGSLFTRVYTAELKNFTKVLK